MRDSGLQHARAVVITVSDRCFGGTQQNLSGPAVVRLLQDAGAVRVAAAIVPDEVDAIVAALREHAEQANLIVTTGGTGLASRDVTPEATRAVCDRLVDGLAERMRLEGSRQTPLAALSRGICGTASNGTGGRVLVINLPGSPAGAKQSLQAILSLLPHALELLDGQVDHGVAPERSDRR